MENPERNKSVGQRKRLNNEQKDKLIEAFEASGQTQRAFCHEQGIAIPTLSSWLRKRRFGGSTPAGFRPVRLIGGDSGTGGAVIRLADGTEIKLPTGSTIEEIVYLVKRLRKAQTC